MQGLPENWSYTNAWLCQFKFGWKSNVLELPSYILIDIYKDIDIANVIGKAIFGIIHTVLSDQVLHNFNKL